MTRFVRGLLLAVAPLAGWATVLHMPPGPGEARILVALLACLFSVTTAATAGVVGHLARAATVGSFGAVLAWWPTHFLGTPPAWVAAGLTVLGGVSWWVVAARHYDLVGYLRWVMGGTEPGGSDAAPQASARGPGDDVAYDPYGALVVSHRGMVEQSTAPDPVTIRRPVMVDLDPTDAEDDAEDDSWSARVRRVWPEKRRNESGKVPLVELAELLDESPEEVRDGLVSEGVDVARVNVRPALRTGSGGKKLAVSWPDLHE